MLRPPGRVGRHCLRPARPVLKPLVQDCAQPSPVGSPGAVCTAEVRGAGVSSGHDGPGKNWIRPGPHPVARQGLSQCFLRRADHQQSASNRSSDSRRHRRLQTGRNSENLAATFGLALPRTPWLRQGAKGRASQPCVRSGVATATPHFVSPNKITCTASAISQGQCTAVHGPYADSTVNQAWTHKCSRVGGHALPRLQLAAWHAALRAGIPREG